jgi:hypothetical protein
MVTYLRKARKVPRPGVQAFRVFVADAASKGGSAQSSITDATEGGAAVVCATSGVCSVEGMVGSMQVRGDGATEARQATYFFQKPLAFIDRTSGQKSYDTPPTRTFRTIPAFTPNGQ